MVLIPYVASDLRLTMEQDKKIFALVSRRDASSTLQYMEKIAGFLHGVGHEVVYESETGSKISKPGLKLMELAEIGVKAKAAIVIGGDGTMLGVARELAPYGVPLIGINHGRLGFMADIPLKDMLPVLSKMLEGKYISEQRILLEGAIIREGEPIYQSLAVNDIVISRGAGSGMIDLRVEVDDHFMYQQRSDGLIISTPTGSTAYALSAGGPMLHPNLGGIVLVSIAPHALSNRPIVIPDTSEIVVEIIEAHQPSINFDSQSFANLNYYDRIRIKRATNTITFLHPEGWSYYDTLRNKLHWNEMSRREKGE